MASTDAPARIDMEQVKDEGQGVCVSRAWGVRERFLGREAQPHFPPVAGGRTKEANGLNQKNGRRRDTGQEKVCRCAPSAAL